ncbi:MAG: DnaJ domain-containing protein [Clostridiales bacterium]|nr:DnaJ domain-containing protein [Clostridiales bacterium]
MAAEKDYYKILGINREADESTIKKAYRKLAKKYHPDTNAGDPAAEEKFKEITEAYTILSDPEKKKLYDRFGSAAFDGSAGSSGSSGAYTGGNTNYREYHFTGNDMGDIFEDLFGDMFGNRRSGNTRRQSYSYTDSGAWGNSSGYTGAYGSFYDGSRRQKGADVRYEIQVSFDEAAFGCDKRFSIPSAGGPAQTIEVHIPAGIDTGKTLLLSGRGQPGTGGGAPGDLYLKVTVGKRPGFERDGMDIYTTVYIPYPTAVLGGEAVVQTLYGNVVCKIREGTQAGSKIRLPGKGIVSMKDPDRRGDQFVTIQIQIPRNLEAEAKRKLKEYQTALLREQPAYSCAN